MLRDIKGGAKAEKVYADLSQYGDKWDGVDLTFSWTATSGNQLYPTLDNGGLPKGDLRSWQKLVVVVDELSNCDFFRVPVGRFEIGCRCLYRQTFQHGRAAYPDTASGRWRLRHSLPL